MTADSITPASPAAGEEQKLLFSIGYGARSIDDFIAALKAHGIHFVVDVRSSPYSKFKQEFSRELLQYHVEKAGMKYIFMGDTLGGQPRNPDCFTDGKVDYDKVRLQPFFYAGLERLRKASEQQQRLALMCSEGKPEQCHRSKLIGETLSNQGIPIYHIDENGKIATQQEVIQRLTGGQLNLFGTDSFTSRKRYGPAPGESEE